MMCLFCGSDSRNRHVASAIMKNLFPELKSISMIPDTETDIKIYNMGMNDSFEKELYRYQEYYQSEYLENISPGTETSTRKYCQDVEKLSFPDSTFDLIISEDVFEHVRNSGKGFQEVHRVLKKGGYHIFTVPCYFDRKTIVRVDTRGKDDIHILPKEYHGDPNRGQILAYRNFGIDIYEPLSNHGFYTEMYLSRYRDQKYGIYDSSVFVSKAM